MFTHTDKDVIAIGAYQATLDNFLLLEPSYRLPDGALWQFYVAGDKHLIGYGLYQRDEGTSWTDGDTYLALESYYSSIQPDTTPNVAGFLADLVTIFGDYVTLNSMYSGWPLFQQTLLEENWTAADDLLTDSYVNYQITTETYTAIVTSAQAHYLPMRLQGRPGLMPLNMLDVVRAIVVPDLQNKTDSNTIGATDTAAVNQYGTTLYDETARVAATDTVNNVMPLEPVTPTDAAVYAATDATPTIVWIFVTDDALVVAATEGAPVIV